MGKSRTYTYSIHIKVVSGRRYTAGEWRTKTRLGWTGYGSPTTANIDKYVAAFEQSMIDGPNKHLGIDQVTEAYIIDQRTGDVAAEWKRSEMRKNQPLFQVIG